MQLPFAALGLIGVLLSGRAAIGHTDLSFIAHAANFVSPAVVPNNTQQEKLGSFSILARDTIPALTELSQAGELRKM